MYRLTDEDLTKLYDPELEEDEDLEAAYYIRSDKDLKYLMNKYEKEGYHWNSGEKPNDFNPWWIWVDADYILFFYKYSKKIYSHPISNQMEIESILGHRV